ARPAASARVAAASCAALPRRARTAVPRRGRIPRLRVRAGAALVRRILAVLIALGLARLVPEHGVGLWVRLAAATLALLLPFTGAGASEALAWSVGALFASLAITFAVHGSLTLTLVLYAVLAIGYALLRRGSDPGQTPGRV